MSLKNYLLTEASSGQAFERAKELSNLLAGDMEVLKTAHMKTQKEAAKIFQQAINLLKGLS
jgi:hypothetical protein